MNAATHTSRQRFTSARAQTAFGALLFVLIAFLLFMSNRDGQGEYEQAKRSLDQIDALNMRLDAALFWSMFELQMDFDLLTELQGELGAAAAELDVLTLGRGAALVDAIESKLASIEDFKTGQSVLRNSHLIATQTIAALRQMPAVSGPIAEELFNVERAFLNFAARRDPQTGFELESVLATAAARDTALVSLPEWQTLQAHLQTFKRYADQMFAILMPVLASPLQPVIAFEDARLAERLSDASVVAGRYRMALFAVAVLLLAFSAFMVMRVRSYLRMIQRANDELESRVAERTKELASVNEALVAEMSERRNVESQLEIARKLESIGQLAAGIAHEINTPTQYVSDNVTFLEGVWRELGLLIDDYERCVTSGEFDAEQAREIWGGSDMSFLRTEVPAAFEEAADGLAQISKIVLAMKTFSHPGSEGLQPSDVNQALESTVTVARNEWKYVAELTLDLDPTLPAVPCNVSALNQVVLNLVVNAAQAIAGGREGDDYGHIRVASRRQGDFAEISIEDDGPGVPEPIRNRIFDPFFTTKEVGKGTGQGLAIAHRVIHQQHRGTLTLEPSDKGARFVIRLPLRKTADPAASAHDEPRRRTA